VDMFHIIGVKLIKFLITATNTVTLLLPTSSSAVRNYINRFSSGHHYPKLWLLSIVLIEAVCECTPFSESSVSTRVLGIGSNL